MNGKPTHWPAAGRLWLALLATGLASGGLARAQQPTPSTLLVPTVLVRPVAPTPGNRPLGEVLAELSRQSGLPFSYSSSLIPVGHRYQLPAGPPRPLGVVLREVLAASHLSYGLLDGQLVLWPDHTALPAGVTAVNGRPSSSQPPRPGQAAFATEGSAYAAGASAGRRPASQAASLAFAARPPAGGGSRPTLAVPPEPHRQTSNAPGTAGVPPAAQSAKLRNTQLTANSSLAGQANHPHHRRPAAQANGQLAVARPSASQPLGNTALPGLPNSRQDKNFTGPLGRTTTGRPANAASRQANYEEARSLALLAPRTILLQNSALLTIPPVLGLLATSRPARETASPSAPKKHLNLANVWDHTYLHGEVWLSETLPVGGTLKIGVQHAYLVLNAAIGPLDRRSGVAWGAGLGTAGRARGRFTPSLDAVAWFLSGDGDDGIRQARLLQLRPLLTWQVKRDGQVSLLAGPTFNLATANHNGNRQWSFGQDQWLWLNTADDQSIIRLWPGVQVGLRF